MKVYRRDFDFGMALKYLQSGQQVSRAGWNGKGMWLSLQIPDAHSKMTVPYIYMRTADGQNVPWLASQTDILASDWTWVVQDNDHLFDNDAWNKLNAAEEAREAAESEGT